MDEKTLMLLKKEYADWLSSFSIGRLRVYGRHVGLKNSTAIKKEVLISAIIAVLVGEKMPVPRNNVGAPVKDDFLDPKIEAGVLKIKERFEKENETAENFNTDVVQEIQRFRQREREMLVVEDPNAKNFDSESVYMKKVYRGQLDTADGVSWLLPLTNDDFNEQIIVPIEIIREYDLREGDVLSCFVQKTPKALIATQIQTINDKIVEGTPARRGRFEEMEACYPTQRLTFYKEKSEGTLTAKYLQWLTPVGKGQRAVVISEPKAGKTRLLLELLHGLSVAEPYVTTLVLLVDQSPETVGQYRKVARRENLVYTTYDDEPEQQVFAAEFILKRAKRLVESGKDVVLLVDSLNSLAWAYNDTEASVGGKTLAGGLESKTLHYLKKYFGAARCLEKGGSLTIIGALACGTGNPADELIASIIPATGNLEIHLNTALAKKRCYPAVDLEKTNAIQNETLWTKQEAALEEKIRTKFLAQYKEEVLYKLIATSSSWEEVSERIEMMLNN